MPDRNGKIFYTSITSLSHISKNAGNVTIILTFCNEMETTLDVDFYGIACIDNPLKRDVLLKLLNELNASKRFGKFIVSDTGRVYATASFIMEENCNDFKNVMVVMSLIIRSIEDDVIGKLMKLQWS